MLSDPETRRLYRLYIDAKKDSAQKKLAEGILEIGIELAKLQLYLGAHSRCDKFPCADLRHQYDDDDWREYVDRELKKL